MSATRQYRHTEFVFAVVRCPDVRRMVGDIVGDMVDEFTASMLPGSSTLGQGRSLAYPCQR